MTGADLILMVRSKPSFQMISNPETQKDDAIKGFGQRALDRIVSFSPETYDFAQDESTIPSVAGGSTYILPGNNSDCGEALSVRFGAGQVLLTHWRQSDMEREVGLYGPITDIQAWLDAGRINGQPRIRLVATPGYIDTIYYRYRRNNLTFEEWPTGWEWVVLEVTLAGLLDTFEDKTNRVINTDANQKAMSAMQEMADNYRKTAGEKHWTVPIDEFTRKRARRRNWLYGY